MNIEIPKFFTFPSPLHLSINFSSDHMTRLEFSFSFPTANQSTYCSEGHLEGHPGGQPGGTRRSVGHWGGLDGLGVGGRLRVSQFHGFLES